MEWWTCWLISLFLFTPWNTFLTSWGSVTSIFRTDRGWTSLKPFGFILWHFWQFLSHRLWTNTFPPKDSILGDWPLSFLALPQINTGIKILLGPIPVVAHLGHWSIFGTGKKLPGAPPEKILSNRNFPTLSFPLLLLLFSERKPLFLE